MQGHTLRAVLKYFLECVFGFKRLMARKGGDMHGRVKLGKAWRTSGGASWKRVVMCAKPAQNFSCSRVHATEVLWTWWLYLGLGRV